VARETYRFAVTVPAGTLQSAPQVTALQMPARVVRRVSIKVPPGPHGLLGIQLTSGGLQMIPINAGQFLTPDGVTLIYDLDGYIDSGAWQLTAYNTGAFPHTPEIVFEVDPTQAAAVLVGPQPLAVDSITA
jgi:hypothetical protein